MDKEHDKQLARFIRLPDVIRRVGLGRTAIYERIRAKDFPQPVKLGRASVWVEAEVQEWINQQITEHREAA